MNSLRIYLDKFNYNYVESSTKIVIFIDKTFCITVEKIEEKYFISNKTIAWSPLSGFFSMSLEKILTTNVIGLLICFVILELLKFSKYSYDYTYIVTFVLTIYFTIFFYYYIKYEILKLKIERILSNFD
ncbi:hypothetical protein AC804_05200 [Chryseobacterium sp. Hurlbut01]|nr:hypothetical protein AC804_05200 [Chryseobacterium sp. Hurlbut01]